MFQDCNYFFLNPEHQIVQKIYFQLQFVTDRRISNKKVASFVEVNSNLMKPAESRFFLRIGNWILVYLYQVGFLIQKQNILMAHPEISRSQEAHLSFLCIWIASSISTERAVVPAYFLDSICLVNWITCHGSFNGFVLPLVAPYRVVGLSGFSKSTPHTSPLTLIWRHRVRFSTEYSATAPPQTEEAENGIFLMKFRGSVRSG